MTTRDLDSRSNGEHVSATFVAAAVAAACVALAGCWLASVLNIWIDEAYTLHTTGQGIAYALRQSTDFELQPPLYFIVLAAWRMLDEQSVFFARIPSVIFAAAATAILVIAARRVAPRFHPLALAATVALNPIVIWAAVEMRVYSLVLLTTSILLLAFVDGFLRREPSRMSEITYILVGAIGLYTQFYVGFVLLAMLITCAVVDRRHVLRLIVANVVIALTFLPFVPTVLRQLHASDGGDVRHVPISKALHELFNANFVYALPHEIAWDGPIKIVGFAAAAILCTAIILIGRPRLNFFGVVTALCCLIASFVYATVFAIIGEAPDIRRHAIAIAPLTILSAIALLWALQRNQLALRTAAIVTYAIFVCGSFWWTYQPPLSKTGDWRRVAARLSTREDVPVIIFPSNLALALGHYLPGNIRLVPFPEPMKFSSTYLASMKLQNEAEVERAFAQAKVTSNSLWVVSDNSCDPGPQVYQFNCGYLKSFLQKKYVARSSYSFHGAIATLYARSSSTPISISVDQVGLP